MVGNPGDYAKNGVLYTLYLAINTINEPLESTGSRIPQHTPQVGQSGDDFAWEVLEELDCLGNACGDRRVYAGHHLIELRLCLGLEYEDMHDHTNYKGDNQSNKCIPSILPYSPDHGYSRSDMHQHGSYEVYDY